MPNLLETLETHKAAKNDKRVFGLVVQGGGMRAVYSCGAMVTLLQYGLTDVFEHVIGSSAGAMNGAYYLSADTEATSIYTEDISNKNFVNLLRRDKKVDIDYLVDLVLKHKRPLNLDKLRHSRSQLHVVVTNAKSGRKEVLSNHEDFVEIYEEFRATAALPMLYDKKVNIKDKWYIDGGVSDLIPLDVAHQLGCTDIVVVMTQRVSNYHFDRRHTRLVNHLIRRYAKNQPSAVRKILPTNEKVLKVNLNRIKHPFKKTRVYLLEPSDASTLISLSTIDKPKVELLAKLGVHDMDVLLHEELVN